MWIGGARCPVEFKCGPSCAPRVREQTLVGPSPSKPECGCGILTSLPTLESELTCQPEYPLPPHTHTPSPALPMP